MWQLEVTVVTQDFLLITSTKNFNFINGYHTESQRQEQKNPGMQHDIVERREKKHGEYLSQMGAYTGEKSD